MGELHYIDSYYWSRSGWTLVERWFDRMPPHVAAGRFEMAAGSPAAEIARWFVWRGPREGWHRVEQRVR
jgi:hypothetical protein